jgi:lipopolysaccharide biosynthesis glycosyltransferase
VLRNAVVIITDTIQFPAAVFLAHRTAALNRRPDTDVILVTDSLVDIEVAKRRPWPFQFEHINVNLRAAGFETVGYVTGAAYYRVFLPRLIGSGYRRILYLDVDTYLQSPKAFDLFDVDMKNYAIAGVRDIQVAYATPADPDATEALKRAGRKYLQSGVLLVDRSKFLASRVEAKVTQVVTQERRLRYNDQSAFNRVLDGHWLELSPSFNMLPAVWNSFVPLVYPPAILHFAGPVKPWHGDKFLLNHPVRAELQQYLVKSPWPTFFTRFTKQAEGFGDVSQKQPALGWKAFDRKGVTEYLTTTNFADVEQRLTIPTWAAWPLEA